MPQAPKVPQVPMVLLVEALQVQSRTMRRQRCLAWRSEGTLSEGALGGPVARCAEIETTHGLVGWCNGFVSASGHAHGPVLARLASA